MSQKNRIQYFTLTAIFMAIVVLQNFVPGLGYLPFGAVIFGAKITIIQITVALSAVTLGPKTGTFIGFLWGVLSLITAWASPVDIAAIMFRNPLTAIIPRALIGLIIGLLFNRFWRNKKGADRALGLTFLGGLSAAINTIFVILFAWIQFSLIDPNITGIPSGAGEIFNWFFTAIVGVNGIFELIANAIVFPIIATAVLLIVEKRNIKGEI